MATGKIYGDMNAGTARRLTQPIATHPGDHLSREAVADAADWFALTLKGGKPLPRGDQIWWGKEIGTGLALIGLAAPRARPVRRAFRTGAVRQAFDGRRCWSRGRATAGGGRSGC